MTDYDAILERCKQDSDIIASFVDDFLVYYCDDRDNVSIHFDREIMRYTRALEDMSEEWFRRVLMQYIASRLFRRGGFAKAYRGHVVMRSRDEKERAWLEAQIERPWHWSFCRIHTHVQDDFYRMIDICTNEDFLLFSPAMSRILDEGGTPMLWMLLLTDNGLCTQTYGPLLPLRGLFPHDVLLLTRQLHANVRRLDQIPACVENDPIPFLMLWWGAENPVVVHKKDILMYNRSDLGRVDLDLARTAGRFTADHAGGVTRLQLKYWSRHPHYAEAYYDSRRASLIATSLSDRGWRKLVEALREAGVDTPDEAEIRGSINATLLIGKILGRELTGHPYRELFEEPVPPEDPESLEPINDFIAIWVEAWNEGKTFDLEEAARATGLDPREARGIVEMIEKRFKDMPPPRGR